MPTYEYRCKHCGESLEVVQSFTDDALTDCPACGTKGQLRKVFGTIGITFKGSGFYKTDSRSASSSSSKVPASSESKSEKSEKSESKPDAKTETKADTKTSTTKTSGSSSGSSTSAA